MIAMAERNEEHTLFARIPEWAWQALKEEAEQENRSATSQLVHILAKRYKITKPKESADAATAPS